MSTATADFNRDGKPDLAVANAASSSISIFIGKGDGAFTPGATVAIPGDCVAAGLVAADFNRDGNPDLLVVCGFQTAFWVLPGLGNGQFARPLAEAPLPYPALVGYESSTGVAVADFNNDGTPDVVLMAAQDAVTTPLYLLLGKGDGTFQPPLLVSNSLNVCVVAADFDGDGYADLAVAYVEPLGLDAIYAVQILRGNGRGVFLQTANYFPPGSVTAMTLADVNRDGRPDLIAAINSAPPQLWVFAANGDGTFQQLPSVPETHPAIGLAAADLRNTGTPDLIEEQLTIAASNPAIGFDSIHLVVRAGNGDGTFQTATPVVMPAGLSPFWLTMSVGDWNGDGLPDLAFTAGPSTASLNLPYANAPAGAAAYQSLPSGELAVILNNPPASPLLSLSTRRLQFTATVLGTTPPAQSVAIANSGGGSLNWTATPSAPWLSVTPNAGSGAASLSVTAAPGSLSPGLYAASVSLNAAGAANSPQTIAVAFTVAPPGGVPSITAVVNGASFFPGIEAGSWVTIFGSNLANTNPGRAWRAGEIVNGALPTSLDGVSVTIGGNAAYVSYISPSQINVQAPSNSAVGPVQVVVNNNGQTSPPQTATLEPYAPAFFQYPGTNYAVVTRFPDNALIGNPAVIPGTVPARPGDVLVLWGTGFGPTQPTTPPGVVVTDSAPAMASSEIDLDGNIALTPLGVAMTPGSAGLYQVAIRLPASVPTGVVPILAGVSQGTALPQRSPFAVFTYIAGQ